MSERGRGEFNWEMLDLWLGAFAGGYEGPYDDNPTPGKPKKRGSKMPINVLWMEANDDPKVQETDRLLRLILSKMQVKHPDYYNVIDYLYLREYANPAESERWRTSNVQTQPGRNMRQLYNTLQKAKRWMLKEVQLYQEGYVLVVPDPINPKGFVEEARKNQVVAKRVYYEVRNTKSELEARRRAAKASGYSLRHLRRIIPKERPDG